MKTLLHPPITKAVKPLTKRLRSKKDMVNQFHLGDRLEVMQQIEDNSIDMIITSPPYNIGLEYANYSDKFANQEYLRFLSDTWERCFDLLKDGGRIAINIPSIKQKNNFLCLYKEVVSQMEAIGFVMRGDILWYKHNLVKRTAWGSWMSPSNPHVIQSYEFILVFSKKNMKHTGDKENIDITKEEFIQFSDAFWKIAPENRLSKVHPAPFPQELVYRLLKFYTYKHDLVLDMFGGSGTVPLVCERLNRNFIYIDNSKDYVQFAKKRFLCSNWPC